MSLRCVTSMNGRPDAPFPTVGRLGHPSPPTRQPISTLLTLRYYETLRLPQARPASFGCPSLHGTLPRSPFVSFIKKKLVKGHGSVPSRLEIPSWDGTPTPLCLQGDRWLSQSFPAILVNTCPALRPRWCPERSPISRVLGLLPSPRLHKVGFHAALMRLRVS